MVVGYRGWWGPTHSYLLSSIESDVKMHENLKIHDYHGNQYLVNIEEDFNDIWWAIRYVDHGDEFILVCTNNEKIFCY